jgi:hypothetical protein
VTENHEYHRMLEGHAGDEDPAEDLKTAQINKQARQAQLEPLQEKATQIIASWRKRRQGWHRHIQRVQHCCKNI